VARVSWYLSFTHEFEFEILERGFERAEGEGSWVTGRPRGWMIMF